MAWNDPPSFDYQQISNSGRKFKHRYVLSDTNSKYGQSSPQSHQTYTASNNNQFQHQSIDPVLQNHTQQLLHPHNTAPAQMIAPPITYNNNNDNGTITSVPASSSSGVNGAYQGFECNQFGLNGYSTNDSSPNNFGNNQSMMYPNQQQQYQSPPPPSLQQMMSQQQQQQQSFQPQ